MGALPTSLNPLGVGGIRNPYVTDGLIAMFDGEWNAGVGRHSSTATTWHNLVPGAGDMDMTGFSQYISIGSDHIHTTPDNSQHTVGYVDIQTTFDTQTTFEFVSKGSWVYTDNYGQINAVFYTPNHGYIGFRGNPSSGAGYTPIPRNANLTTYAYYTESPSSVIGAMLSVNTTTSIDRRDNKTEFYVNGTLTSPRQNYSTTFTKQDYERLCMYVPAKVAADVYCFRLYNRALTTAEMEHNRSLDRERFGV